MNLVQNASHYSPSNSEITLRAWVNDLYLQVDISDEGHGIPLEQRKRVFEPFYQIERVAHGGTAGVGLGLAICKGIVEAHGGRIWIQDRPNNTVGTTVSFTLPIGAGAGTIFP